MNSPIPDLRSPADQVGSIVYFGRMLDKIRLHLAGKLPAEHVSNLGKGFDERCARLLRISYPELTDHLAAHRDASDDQLLEWSFTTGRRPEDDEIEIWNGFMLKRAWNDAMSARLEQVKGESGLGHRADIQTFFQLIDADEGRL